MKQIYLLSLAIIVIAVIGFALGSLSSRDLPFQGYGPRISGDSVINSSSSIPVAGLVIITNASNTGEWFRLTNLSAQRIFCGLGASTSGLAIGGQLLAPITSSTGSNAWEMYDARGAVACMADTAAGTITFSFSGR